MRSILFLLSFMGLLSMNVAAFAEPLDKVVAIVNSTVITQSELNAQMRVVRSQMQASGAPTPSQAVFRKMVLDQLINNTLQLDLAKKAGLTLSDSALDNVIAKIAAQNNMSVPQLYKGVASQGISRNAYREQIRQQVVMHTLQQKALGSQLKVTDQDLVNAKNFANQARRPSAAVYAQYHVVDLLLKTKQEADGFLAQLQAGSSTENLMKKYPETKVDDLGARPLSELPSVFQSPVQLLKPGQFSPVIQAPNGYHILQLVNASGPQQKMPIQPAMTAQQLAFEHKYNEALQQWLQKLRSQSYVKIMND
jgi:peptidyl-prolyl cis-trans isomerase SurA